MQNSKVPITRPCASHRVFLCARYGVDRPLIGKESETSAIDVLVSPVYGHSIVSRAMRLFLAAMLVISSANLPAAAAIYTVEPETIFYSKPQKSEKFELRLPEVRVKVPPMQDARGFCRFKLVYKIADRDNPDLPDSAWARCVVTDRFISK